jgi:hypothetical protein
LFASACQILWKIGVDHQIIQEFTQLAGKAKAAASEAMDAEVIIRHLLNDSASAAFLDRTAPPTICTNCLY